LNRLHRFLCPFARFFRNPHHLSGVVFAMILTNLATLLWAAIVLAQHDAMLRSKSRVAFVVQHVSEDWLAIGFGTLAVAQLVCLWAHWRPTRFRNIGYGLLSLAWSFVFFLNIVGEVIYPVATSLSFAVAFAAFYAWLDGGEYDAQ
jgi:hypothetical protein